MKRDEDYFICAHCGTEVRWDAQACPECGSDEMTGWSEDADKWQAGIPVGYADDEEFDYEAFVGREFPQGRNCVLGLPAALLIALALLAVGCLLMFLVVLPLVRR